jgi:hypothetical protein
VTNAYTTDPRLFASSIQNAVAKIGSMADECGNRIFPEFGDETRLLLSPAGEAMMRHLKRREKRKPRMRMLNRRKR